MYIFEYLRFTNVREYHFIIIFHFLMSEESFHVPLQDFTMYCRETAKIQSIYQVCYERTKNIKYLKEAKKFLRINKNYFIIVFKTLVGKEKKMCISAKIYKTENYGKLLI